MQERKRGIPSFDEDRARKRRIGRADHEEKHVFEAAARAYSSPDLGGRGGIASLQRAGGNGAVGTLIQTKLNVGPAGDRYEVEADQVAKQVVSSLGGAPATADSAQRQDEEEELLAKRLDTAQRQEEEELLMKRLDTAQRQEEEELLMKRLDTAQRQEEEEEPVQMSRLDTAQRQSIEDEELLAKRLDTAQRQEEEELLAKRLDTAQRQEEEEEEPVMMKPVRRVVGLEGGPLDTASESEINAARGGGKPITEGLRRQMEGAFQADFSGVRVHDNASSHSLNESLQARAFTTGSDIFFRKGDYDPGSRGGQELLAHELTHVVQQGGARVQRDRDEADGR